MPNPDPFVFTPSTPETAPRYQAIEREFASCCDAIDRVLMPFATPGHTPTPSDYEAVNGACKAFYEAIRKVCPPSEDRAAAERCVRLARMKANAAMRPSLPIKLVAESAFLELLNAKLQANVSIALALPDELPPWEA
jgi:hypothetical protein